MTYLDFSGLLILAVTCNLVYIVLGKNDDTPYYRFLKNIDPATHIFSKFNIGSQELKYIISIINGIRENINSSVEDKGSIFRGTKEDETLETLFEKDFKKAKKLIEAVAAIKNEDKLDSIKEKIDSEKKKYEKELKRYKNIDNLRYISIMSFFYSFYILFIMPYSNKEDFGFNLNNSLCIMNLVMIVMSLIYLSMDLFQSIRTVMANIITIIILNIPVIYFLYDSSFRISIIILNIITFLIIFIFRLSDKLKFKNLILCVTFLNLMIILAILHIDNNSIIECYFKIIGIEERNYFITVLICFIGFIFYSIPSIICWIYSLYFSFIVLKRHKDVKLAVDLLGLLGKHEERIKQYIYPRENIQEILKISIE